MKRSLKRLLLVMLTSFALVAAVAFPANAEGVVWDHNCDSWKNDDESTARIHVTAKFDAYAYGGSGNYYIKYKQLWQAPGNTGWHTMIKRTHTGNKVYVSHPGTELRAPVIEKVHLDSVLYTESWRVWTRATLYKEMAGPDVRYLRDRLEQSFHKAKFRPYSAGVCSISV